MRFPKFKVHERVLFRVSFTSPMVVEEVLPSDDGFNYKVKMIGGGALLTVGEVDLMSTKEARELRPKSVDDRLAEVRKEILQHPPNKGGRPRKHKENTGDI